VSGPVALHGGGEFLPGDERFLDAILRETPVDRAVRIAIVPTAAARGRPDLVTEHGIAAFKRIAVGSGYDLSAEGVPILDAASAADTALAERLAGATLIYLPGGDPDIIPSLYPGTRAWAAIERARAGGAVLAGASAGAMALGAWTWTPAGGMVGLGVVPGIGVVPHADAAGWDQAVARYGAFVPPGLGFLGLAERTGVIVPAEPGQPWEVVGQGEVRWLTAAGREAGEPAVVAAAFDTIEP